MKQWFVVHTQPAKELLAQQHLLQQGLEVYLPLYRKVRRHARKMDVVLHPLFPRYLFVHLDIETYQWRSVNGTRGVSYLLTVDEKPIPIQDAIIGILRTQQVQEGALPLSSLVVFTAGETVRICDGSFSGHTAVFETLDDKQRVHLLLNFLGRDTKVIIPLYAVEAL